MDVSIDAWDLRHLLLSLDERARDRRDSADLDRVVTRTVPSLSALPRRPTIRVPRAVTAPFLVQGMPLWIFEANAWLLAPDGAGGECVVVDVPPSPRSLVERIRRLRLRPVAAVLTHAHADHAGGAGALVHAFGRLVRILAHPTDHDALLHPGDQGIVARLAPGVAAPPAATLGAIEDGDVIAVGAMTVRALHAPGHTPGSVCLVVEGGARPLLLTGDTLFAGGTGRCDQPGSSRPQAIASLRSVLAPLPDNTFVLPGHGATTTVGRERSRSLSAPTLAA